MFQKKIKPIRMFEFYAEGKNRMYKYKRGECNL